MSSFFANPPDGNVRCRLFCLPHSGGGCARYYTWRHLLPPSIQVVPIQLPGREMRYREEPYTRLEGLIGDLAPVIAPYLDRPYAIFGYSVGGLLGFELSREIRRRGLRLPEALFVAAAAAPGIKLPGTPIHRLSDDELLVRIRERYGGIPEVLLKEKDLLGIYLRVIKADFALLETYTSYEEAPFAFPIPAFGGARDMMVSEADLAGWQAHTTGTFSLTMLPGDHFFINEQQGILLERVKALLNAAEVGPEP